MVPLMETKRNVLLGVSDEDCFFRQMIINTLLEKGYEVVLVFDGDEAYFYLKTADYDFAILDMNMPLKNGLEVVTLLNREQEVSIEKTPVILMSSDFSLEVKKRIYKEGVSHLLLKPFSQENLCKLIGLIESIIMLRERISEFKRA